MKNKEIIIKNSKNINLWFYILIFIICIICIISVVSGNFEPAMLICFSLILLPLIVGVIWYNNYKIIVNGAEIIVKKGIGKTYSFNISDIEEVQWIIVHNAFTDKYSNGKGNENIVIKTKSIKCSATTIMDGFDDIAEYLKNNVDSSKIKIITKK